MDNTRRFDGKASSYAKARPSYVNGLFAAMELDWKVPAKGVIADIGCGTGIFSRQLLEHGYQVYGVEPNQQMRAEAGSLFDSSKRAWLINGDAASTGLPEHVADAVCAAQAFHWFVPDAFQKECRRILKPQGKTILIWNTPDASSPLLKQLDGLNRTYCPVYRGSHNGMEREAVSTFFKGVFDTFCADNPVQYNRNGFIQRALSSSYALKSGDEHFDEYLKELNTLFDAFSENGILIMPYQTVAYCGKLNG